MNVLTNFLPVFLLIEGCSLIQLCLQNAIFVFLRSTLRNIFNVPVYLHIASASSSLFNYANIITLGWVSHVVKLCYIIVTSLLDSYKFETTVSKHVYCILRDFMSVYWKVATSPSCNGVNILTRRSTASLAVIFSRHPLVILLVYIIALAWYYKITISLIIHAMSFWKFLKKQDSLIDAIGKVWHCSVDRSIGTSLLLESFIRTDAIWRTYHQLITYTPTNEANYIRNRPVVQLANNSCRYFTA